MSVIFQPIKSVHSSNDLKRRGAPIFDQVWSLLFMVCVKIVSMLISFSSVSIQWFVNQNQSLRFQIQSWYQKGLSFVMNHNNLNQTNHISQEQHYIWEETCYNCEETYYNCEFALVICDFQLVLLRNRLQIVRNTLQLTRNMLQCARNMLQLTRNTLQWMNVTLCSLRLTCGRIYDNLLTPNVIFQFHNVMFFKYLLNSNHFINLKIITNEKS